VDGTTEGPAPCVSSSVVRSRRPIQGEEDALGEEKVPRKDFIRLGAAVGLGVAGSSVLVACGGGGEAAQDGGRRPRRRSKPLAALQPPALRWGRAIP
jgi:hypothetical protein